MVLSGLCPDSRGGVFPTCSARRPAAAHRGTCFTTYTDRLVYLTLLHDTIDEKRLRTARVLPDEQSRAPAIDARRRARMRHADAHRSGSDRAVFQSSIRAFGHSLGRPLPFVSSRLRRYVLACHRYIELNPVRAGWPLRGGLSLVEPWRECRVHSSNRSTTRRILNISPCRTMRRLAKRSIGDYSMRGEPAFLAAATGGDHGGFPMIGERLKSQVAAMGRQLGSGSRVLPLPGLRQARILVVGGPRVLTQEFGSCPELNRGMADRRLQVFHAVAKHLSFTKAAEALFMTQPAVTFQISQLEEHFNTPPVRPRARAHLAHARRASLRWSTPSASSRCRRSSTPG